MDLKKKELENIITSLGLSFPEWKEETIREGRMTIIDKEGTAYKEWEDELLKKSALNLLIAEHGTNKQPKKDVVEKKQDKASSEEITKTNQNY